MNFRIPRSRGANQVDPQHERLLSVDGKRWALGRNVKRSLPDRRWDVVRVWTLKERGPDGRARTVATHRDESDALAWCDYTLSIGK